MVGFTLGELGRFQVEQKRYSEAEVTFRDCLKVISAALPEGNQFVVGVEGGLGMGTGWPRAKWKKRMFY